MKTALCPPEHHDDGTMSDMTPWRQHYACQDTITTAPCLLELHYSATMPVSTLFQRHYACHITMSLIRPFIPKSDVKQRFTTTTTVRAPLQRHYACQNTMTTVLCLLGHHDDGVMCTKLFLWKIIL